MPNPWIEHVRRYAEQKGVTYACALSDPRVRDGYVSSKGAPYITPSGDVLPATGKKKTMRIKSAAGGMSETALAALGTKELRTLKAADAIITASNNKRKKK